MTLAYDLDRYAVFSNGPFSGIDDTAAAPPAGMFFGPVYPALVAAVMKLDPRFATAARCSVEADRGHRDIATCDPYDLPMRLLNALLLAIAVVAVAAAAELMFRRRAMFLVTGLCVLVALACEADAFSYVMTESLIFAIYSVFMLAMVLAWRSGRTGHFILGGVLLGLLCLTKPSYLVLFPVVAALSLRLSVSAGAGRGGRTRSAASSPSALRSGASSAPGSRATSSRSANSASRKNTARSC